MARKHPTFKEQQEMRWCWRNNSETGILDRLEDLIKQEKIRSEKSESSTLKHSLLYDIHYTCKQISSESLASIEEPILAGFQQAHRITKLEFIEKHISKVRGIYEKDRQYSCVGLLDDIEKYLHTI